MQLESLMCAQLRSGSPPPAGDPDQCVTTLGADSLSRPGPGSVLPLLENSPAPISLVKNVFPSGFHPLVPLFGDQENKSKSSLLERAKSS